MFNSRSSSLSFLAQIFNNAHHFLSTTVTINELAAHTHGDLFTRIGAEQALDQQMSHEEAYKDTAIAAVFLLRAVLKVDEAQRSSDYFCHFATR